MSLKHAPWLFTLTLAVPIVGAQTTPTSLSPALRPYTTCQMASGPGVVEIAQLPESNHIRSVESLDGTKQIEMKDGVRVMYAYRDTDFFANVKAEELPASSFVQEKADLIGDFEHTLASGDESSRNYKLKPTLQGFDIYGLDRNKLEGGVLGIYVLFNNATHVVTTIYFLNADPVRRKFSTLEEYAVLRDQFLTRYTSCIHNHQAADSDSK